MLQLSRKSVKKGFVFFLIFLPVQYLWIGIAGVVWSEPWPAFALPGFKQVYMAEGQSQIRKPLFYLESENRPGEFEQISEIQLFDGIQISQLQGFLRTHFSEPREYSNEAKQWLQNRLEQEYPDKESAGLKVIWKEITYQHTGDSMFVQSEENVEEIKISFDN